MRPWKTSSTTTTFSGINLCKRDVVADTFLHFQSVTNEQFQSCNSDALKQCINSRGRRERKRGLSKHADGLQHLPAPPAVASAAQPRRGRRLHLVVLVPSGCAPRPPLAGTSLSLRPLAGDYPRHHQQQRFRRPRLVRRGGILRPALSPRRTRRRRRISGQPNRKCVTNISGNFN